MARQKESTMTGKDLLKLLHKSGTGSDKLMPGYRLLQENPNATANRVYQAIEDAGWRENKRPHPTWKEGVMCRENIYENTLRKARLFMEGKTLDEVSGKEGILNREARTQTQSNIITLADIERVGLTPDEAISALALNEAAG